jgi:Fic-DOC domain mobile mystery protein B
MGGLIPDYITTQRELNELERQNVAEATTWALGRTNSNTLELAFVCDLHRRMFNRVWKWAGKTRRSNKNIGVFWEQIPTQLATLFQDLNYWIDHQTYSWDEIGARFHHRLVSIHAFPNGNGRHARLMTDIMMESNGQVPFTWGLETAATRDEYIMALKKADAGDYPCLMKFLRS